jgi:transposase
MAAYSLDLRESLMAAMEQGTHTKRALAQWFGVHESFLYKLRRQQRELGHLEPLPHGGGTVGALDAERLAQLEAWLEETPDATLADLQTQLAERVGLAVSLTTVWRALQKLDWPRKKRPDSPPKPTR